MKDGAAYLRAVENLPEDNRHDKDRNAHIRGEKVRSGPVTLEEHGETRHQGDDR